MMIDEISSYRYRISFIDFFMYHQKWTAGWAVHLFILSQRTHVYLQCHIHLYLSNQ